MVRAHSRSTCQIIRGQVRSTLYCSFYEANPDIPIHLRTSRRPSCSDIRVYLMGRVTLIFLSGNLSFLGTTLNYLRQLLPVAPLLPFSVDFSKSRGEGANHRVINLPMSYTPTCQVPRHDLALNQLCSPDSFQPPPKRSKIG